MTFSWLYSSSSLVRASGHPSLDGMLHSSMEIAPESSEFIFPTVNHMQAGDWAPASLLPHYTSHVVPTLHQVSTSAISFLLNNQDFIKLVQVRIAFVFKNSGVLSFQIVHHIQAGTSSHDFFCLTAPPM
ncbi:hypothetical protein MTR67_032306 [Solanum verrucosum]|uniref:Uncharacterized protein n=1 Tax=Solanum verrucosum TaxID=315347 RepID=A0AAF0U487_SOLVR|nr:hypothetical protein MTR67_032306 [Solanum verrucosum]